MAKRDRKMTGPFKEERQLLLPCREANEPNQGGIIEGNSNWYFLTHHGSGDWSGRIVSLLPVTWQDGWPMMGDITEAGKPGKMVWQAAMPHGTHGAHGAYEPHILQRSDDFDA
jgi:beta-xylosidase